MKNHKTIKTLANGVTYDEVFRKIHNIFSTVENGWDIAETFAKLYKAAANNAATIGFFGIVKNEYCDNVVCENTFVETMAKSKKILEKNTTSNVTYYKVIFDADAFLEEIEAIPIAISENILKTVVAYKVCNKDVLTDEECISLDEQISALKEFIELEKKYSLEQIGALKKANEVARRCSKELEQIEIEYERKEFDEEAYIEKCANIETRLCDVWLNKEKDGGRCPIFFEDLVVPENLKRFFDEIYIDY